MLRLVAAGRLSQASAGTLAAALESNAAEGSLILDLQDVDYVSSAALGVIETAATRRAKAHNLLVLCGLQDPVRIALDLAGMLPHIPIEPSPERAAVRIKADKADRAARADNGDRRP